MEKTRVFLVDDHEVLLAGLTYIINSQPDMEVVGVALDANNAVNAVAAMLPDILLLDISLPDISGLHIIDTLKERAHKTKIIILTMYDDEGYLREAIRRGAAGFILKQSPQTEVINAVRNVVNGMTYIDPVLAGNLVCEFWQKPSDGSPRLELTKREVDVLRLIALGYSNKETAEELVVSVKTIQSHRSNIKAKLNLRSRAQLVRYAKDRKII